MGYVDVAASILDRGIVSKPKNALLSSVKGWLAGAFKLGGEPRPAAGGGGASGEAAGAEVPSARSLSHGNRIGYIHSTMTLAQVRAAAVGGTLLGSG